MKAEYFHFGSDTKFFYTKSFFKVVFTDWQSGHQENVGTCTFQQDICGSDTFFQTKNVGISSVHVFFFLFSSDDVSIFHRSSTMFIPSNL